MVGFRGWFAQVWLQQVVHRPLQEDSHAEQSLDLRLKKSPTINLGELLTRGDRAWNCMTLKFYAWTCALRCNSIGLKRCSDGKMLSWPRLLPMRGSRLASFSCPGLKTLIVQTPRNRGFAQSATDVLQERSLRKPNNCIIACEIIIIPGLTFWWLEEGSWAPQRLTGWRGKQAEN